jgi:hypothetical protein
MTTRLTAFLTDENGQPVELRALQYLTLYDAIKAGMEHVDPERSAQKTWPLPPLPAPQPTTDREKRALAIFSRGEWEMYEVLADALANTIKGASDDTVPVRPIPDGPR